MAKIFVIGVTESASLQLPLEALTALQGCDVVMGAPRHLAKAKKLTQARQIIWASPLSKSYTQIERLQKQDKDIAVLATGDPMFFGIGASLMKRFKNISIIPAVGAFASATAKLGWASKECDFVTLHGRPLQNLRRYLKPQGKVLALSHDNSTPAKIATYLTKLGYGKSEMWVLSDMGSPTESIKHFKTLSQVKGKFSDLNTVALSLQGVPQDLPLGLTDSAFEHDGVMTKEEVRAVTMLRLAPYNKAHLWDLGAGCGSISVSWAVAGGTTTSIESNPKRIKMIQTNAENWGVKNAVDIIKGDIGKSISSNLPSPDAIFWGGGIDSLKTLDKSFMCLKKGGIFVANAVTSEAMQILFDFHGKHEGNLVRIQTERLEAIGSKHSFTPARAVMQYWIRK